MILHILHFQNHFNTEYYFKCSTRHFLLFLLLFLKIEDKIEFLFIDDSDSTTSSPLLTTLFSMFNGTSCYSFRSLHFFYTVLIKILDS